MIGVFTGLPGAGKTLFAITWIKAKAEKEGRPVYYSGIADLKLPWFEVDPLKWMDCPPNSIIVVDECQRVFRPRANGSTVPECISAMETHRHKGVDIFLITQHPSLIDQNIRRLCGLHFHLVRKWGTQSATAHEWPSIKDNCDKSRKDSTQHAFPYPKNVYELYKSAEVHTHKARIPTRLYVLAAVPVLLALAGWRLYSSMNAKFHPDGVPVAASADAQKQPASQPAVSSRVMSKAEYVGQFQPRVPGLAYTAPVYDKVTAPVRAPYPAACVQSKNRCQCYTQQGTRLETSQDLCTGIVAGGFFMAWDERSGQAVPQPLPAAKPASTVEPLPGYLDLTPGHQSAGTRVASADQALQDGQGIRAARSRH